MLSKYKIIRQKSSLRSYNIKNYFLKRIQYNCKKNHLNRTKLYFLITTGAEFKINSFQ